MSTIVYLDTNVWLDLIHRRNGVQRAHIRLLQNAVRTGRIELAMSVFNLEELLPKAFDDGSSFSRQLQFILDMVHADRFIREPRELVSSHVSAALAGLHPESDYDSESIVLESLGQLVSGRLPVEFLQFIDWARRQARDFRRTLNGMRDSYIELCKPEPDADSENRIPPVEEVWDTIHHSYLQEVLERVVPGVVPSQEQTERLKRDNCVALAVGYPTCRTYELFYLEHAAQAGDSRDHLHCISASAADVFVTGDGKLRRTLSLMPTIAVRVIGPFDLFELCRKRGARKTGARR